ncbi:MAG: ATP-dependent sacrificial sulfur transferase LarE [Spirochaetaceae bacterium]|jgi:uncharacterized protein|nr:ATP-dependent sacrificial sulfur transferase LarE [Spirochaetaceae bacterium]
MTLEEKYAALIAAIAATRRAAVAFSGGVDSSLLCHAAVRALGADALAITLVSPMLARSELEWARRVARHTGIHHILLEDATIENEVAQNTKDRCYYCKKIEFGAIIKKARETGAETVLDGSNADDERDYRPGLRAVAELAIRSPLRELRFSKAEIRELSMREGLPTWDKPAHACLASRFPYGERIDAEKLHQVEAAEAVLREAGFVNFRVRYHGNIARLEVAPDERRRFFDEAVLDQIAGRIRQCGFLYVAFELSGYRMGSLNAALGSGA